MADHTDPGIEKTVGLTVNVSLCGRHTLEARPGLSVGSAKRNGAICGSLIRDPIKRKVQLTDVH